MLSQRRFNVLYRLGYVWIMSP